VKAKKWDVFDHDGKWLGTILGATEAEALSEAKEFDMITAVSVKLCRPKDPNYVDLKSSKSLMH